MNSNDYLDKRMEQSALKYQRLQDDAVAAKADFHKFSVARAVQLADLPEGSIISLMCWDDEPNEDGTYDVGFDEVVDQSGEFVADLAGEFDTVWSLGWADGDHTDIDDFLTDDEDPRIDVDKVNAWIKTICPTTIRVI